MRAIGEASISQVSWRPLAPGLHPGAFDQEGKRRGGDRATKSRPSQRAASSSEPTAGAICSCIAYPGHANDPAQHFQGYGFRPLPLAVPAALPPPSTARCRMGSARCGISDRTRAAIYCISGLGGWAWWEFREISGRKPAARSVLLLGMNRSFPTVRQPNAPLAAFASSVIGPSAWLLPIPAGPRRMCEARAAQSFRNPIAQRRLRDSFNSGRFPV